jgi:hypothetical protein
MVEIDAQEDSIILSTKPKFRLVSPHQRAIYHVAISDTIHHIFPYETSRCNAAKMDFEALTNEIQDCPTAYRQRAVNGTMEKEFLGRVLTSWSQIMMS